MKTKTMILAMAAIACPIVGAILFKGSLDKPSPQQAQLTLEQILSIKELHLVRHSYTDVFFIHRRNNTSKPVRAIARVPVNVSAYLNLKEIRIEKEQDTIRRVVLPSAKLTDPVYDIGNMEVTRLREFHFHAGSDLYADVANYLQQVIHTRQDSVLRVAIRNHITDQAEAEAKEYIETLLKAVGRPDIAVTFGDANKDRHVTAVQHSYIIEKKDILTVLRRDTTEYRFNYIADNN